MFPNKGILKTQKPFWQGAEVKGSEGSQREEAASFGAGDGGQGAEMTMELELARGKAPT